jgi:xanthine dehydrogenase accessory factor
MTSSVSHIEALSQLAMRGQPFVAVTMIESTGSTPQDAGSKMLVDQTGLVHGTVGGGKVEHRAISNAQSMLQDKDRKLELLDWNLQRDIGMTCGGLVKLLFEVYNRDEWSIIVFGAGHVAQALVRILVTLDCKVTCIDSRQEWIDRLEAHNRLTATYTKDTTEQAAKVETDDFVICMTMGHSTDRPILSTIFKRGIQPAFLGAIGSKSKRGALLRELKSDGIPDEMTERLVCPVGLPIGTNQPSEIAISIVAQLLQVRDQLRKKN